VTSKKELFEVVVGLSQRLMKKTRFDIDDDVERRMCTVVKIF